MSEIPRDFKVGERVVSLITDTILKEGCVYTVNDYSSRFEILYGTGMGNKKDPKEDGFYDTISLENHSKFEYHKTYNFISLKEHRLKKIKKLMQD